MNVHTAFSVQTGIQSPGFLMKKSILLTMSHHLISQLPLGGAMCDYSYQNKNCIIIIITLIVRENERKTVRKHYFSAANRMK